MLYLRDLSLRYFGEMIKVCNRSIVLSNIKVGSKVFVMIFEELAVT